MRTHMILGGLAAAGAALIVSVSPAGATLGVDCAGHVFNINGGPNPDYRFPIIIDDNGDGTVDISVTFSWPGQNGETVTQPYTEVNVPKATGCTETTPAPPVTTAPGEGSSRTTTPEQPTERTGQTLPATGSGRTLAWIGLTLILGGAALSRVVRNRDRAWRDVTG
jgi:LPXTG-motif cell wall-anchored protein